MSQFTQFTTRLVRNFVACRERHVYSKLPTFTMKYLIRFDGSASRCESKGYTQVVCQDNVANCSPVNCLTRPYKYGSNTIRSIRRNLKPFKKVGTAGHVEGKTMANVLTTSKIQYFYVSISFPFLPPNGYYETICCNA